MAIKLRVISDQCRDLGEHGVRVFGVNGGTIGRAPDNDWVLPDPRRLVSGHHCDIEYRSGAYWLTDKSTNGVFVNESDDPVSQTGPVALHDGDRLRMGDFEIAVSVDDRIDFLPSAAELHSAAKHLDSHIGADLDLDSLLSPRGAADSGSISVRNAFGFKLPREHREALLRDGAGTEAPATEAPVSAGGSAPPAAAATPEWALKTRPVTRQELAEALARRQHRAEARQQALPFHQQATTWADLTSAVQAFCRGAGIDPSALSPEAQSMLPLLAGQLLREALVGLNELQQARPGRGPAAASAASAQSDGGNILRTSSGVEHALVRLLESHGRVHGGPVDALRDALLDVKEHEAALDAGMRAGLKAVLEQLAPANVADQFEQGRARTIAPGQDPRPRYWEHYAELHRVIVQNDLDGVPRSFVEAFTRAYDEARRELAARRRGRGGV